ncbi:MAG: PatA/PatG family cyanobactin maturation protease [Coleofasciculus sp.]
MVLEVPGMAVNTNSVTDISALPGLKSLWAESMGDPRVCVAILDGPVDESHSCFDGASLTRLPTLVSDIADSGLMSGHGTHITSTIFGQPDSPVQGIAPNCRGLIVPVFSDHHQGSLSQMDLARAINQAVEQGANVINISGGQLSQSGEADPILAKAVRFCNDNGVLIVAAAGNDACRCLHVPAALPAVLAVGAMKAQGSPFDFSNWGDIYQTQGILAPGKNILGAEFGGGTTTKSGTSFATPIVSGIVALLLSIQLQKGDKPNPHAIRDAILKSALPCNPEEIEDYRRCLAGHLNILGAYKLITKGGQNQVSEESMEAAILQPSDASAIAAETANQLSETLNFQLEESGNPPLHTGVQAAEIPTPRSTSTIIQNEGNTMNMASTQVVASGDCGCKTATVTPSNAPTSLIYALGVVGYDFATEARRDSFKQLMPLVRSDTYEEVQENASLPTGVFAIPANPYDARQMANYLEQNPSEAKSLIWTLNLELTPIYAIEPQGPYAFKVYEQLVEFLKGQVLAQEENDYIERVSIPAITTNKSVQLFSGQVVPVIEPINIRGMYGWKINNLIESVLSTISELDAANNVRTNREEVEYSLRNFLTRIYYDLRNLGQTSEERALNYAATNVFQYAANLRDVLRNKVRSGTSDNSNQSVTMQLDSIDVVRSPFCRKDSDCWDVKLKFFDPENDRRANRVLRYTIDVSDIMPVTLGTPRLWDEPR